jgi:bifunctional UDP-N-acetylglucosamine pyrophosphorylase/glucosamine-1-phosphate N-acetyltransferase
MDAILLAAGLGTRLRPHTLTTPKPLLPVQGRPILDWILGALPREVERVLVVVNYLAEQVEAYLQDQRHFAHWRAVRQEQPRGTGDAFRSCTPYLEADRVLVLNGDDLIGAADLSALVHHPAGLLDRPDEQPGRSRTRGSTGSSSPEPTAASSIGWSKSRIWTARRWPTSGPTCSRVTCWTTS